MRLQKVSIGWLALAFVASGAAPAAAGGPDKAADILAQTRAAIGGSKLDTLKTFSLEARSERNIGNFQMKTDVELMIGMPDKYLRVESSSGGPANFSTTTGFDGDRPLARGGTSSGGGTGGLPHGARRTGSR